MRKIKGKLLTLCMGIIMAAAGMGVYAAPVINYSEDTVDAAAAGENAEGDTQEGEGASSEEASSEETTTEAVTEAATEAQITEDGIDQFGTKKALCLVKVEYYDENENYVGLAAQGVGFFIGDADGTYVLTAIDSVKVLEEKTNWIGAYYGLDSTKIKTKVKIIPRNSDLIFDAEVVKEVDSKKIAIVRPTGDIKPEGYLRLSEDSQSVASGAPVFSYYVGMANSKLEELQNVKNVLQIKGTIDNWTVVDGEAHTFQYYTTNVVNWGMPLIDETGKVIGININTGNNTETGVSYALQIYDAIEVLKLLDINYNPDIEIDTTALDEKLAAYEEKKEEEYTELSWKEYTDAYNNAKAIKQKIVSKDVDSFTQEKVNQVVKELTAMEEGLKDAGIPVKTVLMISIIAGSVMLALIIFLTILLIVKCKKYKKLLKAANEKNISAEDALKLSGRVTPGDIKNSSISGMPINRSLAETSQGMAAEPETSVLSSYQNPEGGYIVETSSYFPSLIRVKTGENIVVNKNNFVIGTSQEMVDYFVRYNSSISRQHASIMKLQDGYYIKDLETTNGTYVNGGRLPKGGSVRLYNGNIIGLAEESFEFRE